jgi:hypothetical protein
MFRLLPAPWSRPALTPTPLPSEPEGGPGDHTHDTSTLEVKGDVGGLPVQAIELSNGIAGGEEAK